MQLMPTDTSDGNGLVNLSLKHAENFRYSWGYDAVCFMVFFCESVKDCYWADSCSEFVGFLLFKFC